jgi:sulfonate transport system substrate-binding protein
LKGDAIVVPADSPIKSLKDLKGKKVAVAKGSAAFNFLYRAIDYAGLKPEDVNIIQLQPNEAQPAFESGAVDAWSIWEPFITIEQIQRSAKVLASGETIQAPDPGFVIARTKMLKDHPELAVVFLQVFNQSIQWEKEHQEESIDFFAALKKLDKKIVKQVVENDESTIEPITDQIVQNQQKTADFLYSLGGIKQKIDVSKVVDNSFVEKALKNVNK